MKRSMLMLIAALGLGAAAYGQSSPGTSTPASAPATNAISGEASSIGRLDLPPVELDLQTSKVSKPPVKLGGPLIEPFKKARPGETSKRLLHLVNPFAPVEPRTELTRVGKLGSRPWAVVTGWHPGASAFPDERTHEPTAVLISVSR